MTRPASKRILFKAAAAGLGVILALVLGEAAARVAVASMWDADRLAAFIAVRSVVGKFASHPYLPYVLASDLRSPATTHNHLGFRGPETAETKAPDTFRIACIGSSTTYGFPHRSEHSYPMRLQQRLNDLGVRAEVINAGVQGWVSPEILLNLQLRILPLNPDLVIAYLGRNDVFPQAWRGFSADYAHYRRRDYRLETANLGHKLFFRWSHLGMILCTWKGERFGWSSRDQNPVYGSIRFENQPAIEEFGRNLDDPARGIPFRSNVAAMAAVCSAREVPFVLGTEAVRGEKLATGNMPADSRLLSPFTQAVAANDRALRDVSRERGLLFVETAVLAAEESLFPTDDCHLSPEGYDRLAALFTEALRSRPGLIR